jgi:hypothetical protein
VPQQKKTRLLKWQRDWMIEKILKFCLTKEELKHFEKDFYWTEFHQCHDF